MGQVFCCHSSRSEHRKLKHLEFRSESTIDDLEIYNEPDCTQVRKADNQTTAAALTPRPTSRSRAARVSSYAGVCAFMGLAPIVEETGSSDSKSSSSPRNEPISTTRFLSNGSMKHYQRFVTPH